MNFTKIMAFAIFSFYYFFSGTVVQAIESQALESYVVTFAEGTSEEIMRGVLEAEGLEVTRVFDDFSLAVIKTDNPDAVSGLESHVVVLNTAVEDSFMISDLGVQGEEITASGPNDPYYQSFQWHIRRVGADQAWNGGYTASHDTVVGIIDVGVASNHPDLASNMVYEACFTSFQSSCDPYPQFPSNLSGNHGTRMAGIIGAAINDYGVVGVAPDVGIANLNVSEVDSNGYPAVFDSSIWAAIEDAVDKNINVLNLSFTEYMEHPLSEEQLGRVTNWRRVINHASAKGVTIIAAAGNSGLYLDSPEILAVPCELPGVLCVGATNARPLPVFPQLGFYDEQTFYTSYGKKSVDILAPGGDCGGPDLMSCYINPNPYHFVWTTDVLLDQVCSATGNCPTYYNASIGTSVATPHVAGVASLMIDAYHQETGKDLQPNQVKKMLQDSAEDIGLENFGAGMVNAMGAIQEALKL